MNLRNYHWLFKAGRFYQLWLVALYMYIKEYFITATNQS